MTAGGTGFAGIRDKIERAFRNQERLHLDVVQVRALVQSPLFPLLAELVAKEFAESWQEDLEKVADGATPAASNSDPSGSTGAPTAPRGSSAGTTTGAGSELLELAARRRALSIAKQMGGRPRKP